MKFRTVATSLMLALAMCTLAAWATDSSDAETLYRHGQFEAALPIYKHAAEESGINNTERARRLRLYGDCLSKCNKPHEARGFSQNRDAVVAG
jgi:hypothetical protein